MVCAACGIDARGTFIDPSPVATIPAPPPADDDAGSPPIDAGLDTSKPPPATPLCDGDDATLIACFGFEGSVTDGSSARIIPLQSDNVGFAPGREGQAVVFTLTPKTDFRLPPATLNTAQATIEMWIRPATLPAAGARTILVDENGRFGVILQSDGTISCRSVNAATKATIGKWTHLACVHDGAMLSAYVDGQLEASAPNTLGTTSDFVGIGEDSTSTADGFDGMMDNLRIWSRALSSLEVSAAASR